MITTILIYKFLLVVFLMALFVNSVYMMAEKEGMILYFIRIPILKWKNRLIVKANVCEDKDKIIRKADNLVWLEKPLYKCVACMSSVWGSIAFFACQVLFEAFKYNVLLYWIAACICCVYVSTLLRVIIDYLIKERY